MESEVQEDNHPVKLELTHHSLALNLDTLCPVSPASSGSLSSPASSPDNPELVKLVLLGAPAVGKTSIIQQLVWNKFSSEYSPTVSRHTYYPSVVINGRQYGLRITDLPALPYFPVSSVYELRDCGPRLREATAYILVLDLSDLDTFRYLENLREQNASSNDNFAFELLSNMLGNARTFTNDVFEPFVRLIFEKILESRESESTEAAFLVVGNKIDLFDCEDATSVARRRAVMERVRAAWGCGYTECSARYSSLVLEVFRQLMTVVDERQMASETVVCPSLFTNLADAFPGAKCAML